MHGKHQRDFYDRGARRAIASPSAPERPAAPEEIASDVAIDAEAPQIAVSGDEEFDDLPKEPPTDGRLLVLIMPDGAAVPVRAKNSRRFVRGQGWQQYRQWISALTGEAIAEPYASWRPWPEEFAA